MTDNLIAVCGVGILLWSQAAFSIPNSQLALDIAAESTAKVVLYYMGKPVVSDQIDFPLPVNGNSQKFEQTSTFFHLVGNVPQSDIIFTDTQFVLPQIKGGNDKIILSGSFILNKSEKDATLPLRVPVVSDISQGTIKNGVKIRFVSEKTAGFYRKGSYALCQHIHADDYASCLIIREWGYELKNKNQHDYLRAGSVWCVSVNRS
ncbi:hypothetical protein [Escherichia coli]|uniref:hypothetical protein n=1 Tax=Escherichia coli TaxID=562 RepID=UPI003F55A4F0